jgi:hypothetical protein
MLEAGSLRWPSAMSRRCRRCTSTDRAALVDEMSVGAWEAARYVDRSADVREPGHSAFRQHTDLMLRVLERDHGHDNGAVRCWSSPPVVCGTVAAKMT